MDRYITLQLQIRVLARKLLRLLLHLHPISAVKYVCRVCVMLQPRRWKSTFLPVLVAKKPCFGESSEMELDEISWCSMYLQKFTSNYHRMKTDRIRAGYSMLVDWAWCRVPLQRLAVRIQIKILSCLSKWMQPDNKFWSSSAIRSTRHLFAHHCADQSLCSQPGCSCYFARTQLSLVWPRLQWLSAYTGKGRILFWDHRRVLYSCSWMHILVIFLVVCSIKSSALCP